jgi:hypothetical protein
MKRNIDIYRAQSCSEEVDGRSEVSNGQGYLFHSVCVCSNSHNERYNRILDKILKLAIILGTGLYKFKFCNDSVRKTVDRG